MIIIRNVFHIEPSGMKEAIEIVKEGSSFRSRAVPGSCRISTDLTGDFYTLVLEMGYNSFAEFEAEFQDISGDVNWKQWYDKLRKHVRGGKREIFNVVATF
jgi:hypothetical protein